MKEKEASIVEKNSEQSPFEVCDGEAMDFGSNGDKCQRTGRTNASFASNLSVKSWIFQVFGDIWVQDENRQFYKSEILAQRKEGNYGEIIDDIFTKLGKNNNDKIVLSDIVKYIEDCRTSTE